jgi:hypothetical protein
VTFEDICDEFTGGIRTPEAIRRFLAYAGEQWSQAPRYVLFGATGHLDYRGLLGPDGLPNTADDGQTVPNPLPPLMASTPYGLYACESCFGDEDGDGVPRAALGRLPAYTSEELSAMIAKIKGYEAASASGAWQAQVTLVADNPDRGGNFPADSAALKALIPQDPGKYQIDEIYLPSADARTQLLSVFDSSGGARNVSYIGHGTSTQWAAEGLLKTSDVAAMSNADRLPVVSALTCEVGRFELPGGVSLAEALVAHEGGGAAAVVSPSGLSLNSQAKVLNDRLFQSMFQDGERVIGEAFLRALEDYRDTEGSMRFMLDIYNCACDPATTMPPAL